MILIRHRFLRLIRSIVAVVAVSASGASAASDSAVSAWYETEQLEMRLVSAVAGMGELEEIRFGLQFRMQPGWKIYWRSPGTAGFPPEIDWSQSANLSTVDVAWPAPERFTIFDLDSLGYKDEVVLPLTVRPESPGAALRLRAEVNYLTCKELCVPGNGMLALDIPSGPAAASPHAALIDRFRAQVPVDAAILGVTVEQAVVKPVAGEAVSLRLAISSETAFAQPDIFVEGPLTAFFEAPSLRLSDDGRRVVATLRGSGAAPAEMISRPLLVTLLDGDRAVEQAIDGSLVDVFPAVPPGYGASATGGGISLWAILGLALLGGLILNLMPCVLPVLSLKFLSVLGHGGREKTDVRLGFLASVAGIITSFLVLAAALAAMKAAGASVGWGIQFQQPVFLSIMVVVITLFACNLFGFFEILLPQRISNLIAVDTGPRHEHHHSLGGHFLTGAFATLLATPCSAPFLGTAVGFALSRGIGEIFLVFAALGLGLSAPYLLVAAFPGMATQLPRPGGWMVTMKRVLGLLLVATGGWLITVIASETGTDTAVGIAGLAAAIGIALWLRGREGSRLGRHAGKVAALLAVAIMAAPVIAPSHRTADGQRSLDDAVWRVFDEDEIRRLVADGQTVLVDVTADWCITCQVNKAAVLKRDPVASLLENGEIVAMRADWTLPSQEIGDYLAQFGRYGIPFNAVYGPNAPDGVMLPEILLTESVLTAINQARGDGGLASQ
ncbi:MAG: thioredoxin family protein [Rhodospirillales bacterium]|nr:MAG: thioredoxin family protein [Rhodospirillales bacterium]